jgi:hypothetical protein
MKTFVYYALIFIPLLLLLLLSKQIGGVFLAIGLLFYAIVYRPIIDYFRLKEKQVNISFSQLMLREFFYYPKKYFKKLYL